MISFLSKIIKINNLHVVGFIKKENEEIFNVLTIRKKGTKINIVSQNSFETFDTLVENIDTRLPLLLVIDGKGILSKQISFSSEVDVNWQKNIDYNSIFFTSLKTEKSNFISFCRKNIVEDTLLKFQNNGFQIIDIYIGSFLSALLNSSINTDKVLSSDLLLEFDNNTLISFTKQTEPIRAINYTIEKEEIISSVFLPLYGTLIHFFLHSKEVSKTQNEVLNSEEIIYKKAFNIFGAGMLVSFFIALLTSYLLINHYGSKNAALNLKNVYSNQSYQMIIDLEKQKKNKEDILIESGFLSSKFLTFYTYEIVKAIPKDIALIEINVTPLDKEIKTNQKVSFQPKTIIVKGETFNESSFNNWIESLKKMNWLQHFEILSLKKDKKNKSQFEVKITIKDV